MNKRKGPFFNSPLKKGEHEIEIIKDGINWLPGPETFRITISGSIVYQCMEYYTLRTFLHKLVGKHITNYRKHIHIDGKLYGEHFRKAAKTLVDCDKIMKERPLDVGEIVLTYDHWRKVVGFKLRNRYSFTNLDTHAVVTVEATEAFALRFLAEFNTQAIQRDRQHKGSKLFCTVLEIAVFEVEVVLAAFNRLANTQEEVSEVMSYLRNPNSRELTRLSPIEACEYAAPSAIEQRREAKIQAYNDGKTVSHPIFCEVALMVGHSRRSDVRKKSAFKICWWPLIPELQSGQIVCKFKYERSEAGMVI